MPSVRTRLVPGGLHAGLHPVQHAGNVRDRPGERVLVHNVPDELPRRPAQHPLPNAVG